MREIEGCPVAGVSLQVLHQEVCVAVSKRLDLRARRMGPSKNASPILQVIEVTVMCNKNVSVKEKIRTNSRICNNIRNSSKPGDNPMEEHSVWDTLCEQAPFSGIFANYYFVSKATDVPHPPEVSQCELDQIVTPRFGTCQFPTAFKHNT
ncbi:unnamed protein product [Leptosia nina]|uniref:Uncharacterized protein n=1 Tax=Leptosia nina TaxID=320188 RepID=A0AAV1J3A1_9NEOP